MSGRLLAIGTKTAIGFADGGEVRGGFTAEAQRGEAPRSLDISKTIFRPSPEWSQREPQDLTPGLRMRFAQ